MIAYVRWWIARGSAGDYMQKRPRKILRVVRSVSGRSSLPACLPACLSTSMPTCLPACLPACPPTVPVMISITTSGMRLKSTRHDGHVPGQLLITFHRDGSLLPRYPFYLARSYMTNKSGHGMWALVGHLPLHVIISTAIGRSSE